MAQATIWASRRKSTGKISPISCWRERETSSQLRPPSLGEAEYPLGFSPRGFFPPQFPSVYNSAFRQNFLRSSYGPADDGCCPRTERYLRAAEDSHGQGGGRLPQ